MQARQHRFRRTEDFRPITLTERDTEILRMVNRHRFLRSTHIIQLVGGSPQQTLRRLQALYHHRYLERPICQLDHFQNGGSRPIVYSLASRGAAHLRRVQSTPFKQLAWTTSGHSTKRIFLEHSLMISDTMVALELACRQRGDVRLLIEYEIPLPSPTSDQVTPFQWNVIGPKGEKVCVIPDCVFVLESADKAKRILCFLEADRGTMPVVRFKFNVSSILRKIRSYALTWKTEIHRSRFGVSRVRVLMVTSSVSRCENIRSVASSATDGGGIFLRVSAKSYLSADNCLGSIWMNSANELVSLWQ
ncbi:MAG: replication-relaxation family protein [Chthoniobacteraceae bacterium]